MQDVVSELKRLFKKFANALGLIPPIGAVIFSKIGIWDDVETYPGSLLTVSPKASSRVKSL